jgi:hypothetical protein
MERPALADHHVTGAEGLRDGLAVSWRDLRGLTSPAGADVVAPEPGGAGAAGELDPLLYFVFSHGGS